MKYLTEEWKQMSERLDEATKARITAQNEAGEAKSELLIVQVLTVSVKLVKAFKKFYLNYTLRYS